MQPFLQAREQLKHTLDVGIKTRKVGDGRAHLQIFQHRHAGENAAAFRRLRDAQLGDIVRRHIGNVAAVEDDLAFARARIAEDGHHQGRLAGAVGADERDDLALIYLERDALKRDDIAVEGLDAADGKKWRGRRIGIADRGVAHGSTSASTISTSSSATPR
jgi:hypothetical protein